MHSAAPELLIDPSAQTWSGLIGHDTGERARRFRRALGLPTDTPIVISGHQAQIWHPGILSKYLAACAAGEALHAHPAWLVVDQDTGNPLRVRYALIGEDGGARAGELDLGIGEGPGANRPLGLAPSARIVGSCPEVLRPIGDALRAHEGATSLSEQTQGALEDLLAPLTPPIQRVRGLALNQTDLFAEVVQRMADDPEACRSSYNRAASAMPEAGVRTLRAGDARSGVELPLWDIRSGERRRVYASDLGGMRPGDLAARGLLMTGLMRLAGCDLFLHGTGGGVYDRVTDSWFEAWLGERPGAPSVVVSATIRLEGAPESQEVQRAERLAWRAHAARHNPGLLGDADASARKRALVERIRSLGQRDRAGVFLEMHELLDRYRREHAEDLAALDAAAREAGQRAGEARRVSEIARDRTLPFPMYPAERLVALRGAIRDRLGLRP
ncbi:MAG: hypothetical protein ACIARR_04610 [Phycisphaerales bacterium JB059]